MTRFRLTVEYDGADFVGWQRQDNGPSIQEHIENAVHALSSERATLFAAGRTDAGVHALAMTAHVDIEKPFRADVVRDALNQHLRPAPIAILGAEPVGDDFHARFSCIGRSYEYRIVNRRPPLTFERGRAWRVGAPLDAEAMHDAAQSFVGRHDFTSFRAAQCQAETPVKTLKRFSVSREGEMIVARCGARSFLHHQVRSMVGSLVEVGRGKWRRRDIDDALRAKDRAACGPVAPPDGLYFVRADYENA